jgi:hypothetical protein
MAITRGSMQELMIKIPLKFVKFSALLLLGAVFLAPRALGFQQSTPSDTRYSEPRFPKERIPMWKHRKTRSSHRAIAPVQSLSRSGPGDGPQNPTSKRHPRWRSRRSDLAYAKNLRLSKPANQTRHSWDPRTLVLVLLRIQPMAIPKPNFGR